ncbi:MAG TPA: oligopeptide transporter, OPT family [Thermoanaerobaculales bacterium]|nr:oligopeptide transporter, OPT family [Thermoanaerobaculales bacterium]HPA80597.1 oligopeptide transporter, OPT family [Thermoanaerobaculales bacterium]HQL31471.1 oligopeptide transporter, OPT family [Thermoanaerobaculales bacterium]HQN96923.1 oligopeptide transporter, OPT family [Thermoanaerobaculales bacterium]
MSAPQFRPVVAPESDMREFTFRALILGLLMSVILGAANAYLGLKAGMTIAATYPAAVIGMAVLKLFKGTLLEENFARTVGSIGESVAAGAIFTIPAFAILHLWEFNGLADYLKATALMVVGGVLGILFVTMLRRVMVEDPELPFPESVAASEIHKAGQRGAAAAKQLFEAMGVGALINLLGQLRIFSASNDFLIRVGEVGRSIVRLGFKRDAFTVAAGGTSTMSAPAVSPAYLGVGYIIGPQLAALNFAGGLLAWGLFVPILVFFLGPGLIDGFAASIGGDPAADATWVALSDHLWKFIVRPIAVGGMLVGAAFTLYRMRKNLWLGIRRSVSDLRKSAEAKEITSRVDRDIDFKIVLFGVIVVFILMCLLYAYFTGVIGGAVMAALVMVVTGFFFAAVSGNLVGLIGSSNNPVSGLTLATLIVAALVMVIVGVSGDHGVAAVLGVASVVCVSSAVAGEMLQDLKVGHILGGTPWKMQVGDLIGVVAAGAFMFVPLFVLHFSNIKQGGIGFGDRALAAPQAGLMATLSQGIVGGEMAWPLVIVGIVMGVALILVRVKSPMLFAVGMYLPLETTFAIFVGGVIRWVVDTLVKRRGFNAAQGTRVENAGVLTASGLIAGEALMGLVIAGIVFFNQEAWEGLVAATNLGGTARPLAVLFMLIVAGYLILRPLGRAGRADEPAPPQVTM